MQIFIRQISGLGNQLFQYAAGLYFTRRYVANLKVLVEDSKDAFSHGHPRPFLLPQFSIQAPCVPYGKMDRLLLSNRSELQIFGGLRRLAGVVTIQEVFERRFDFMAALPLSRRHRRVYLTGYWQSCQYAQCVEDELRAELAFRLPAQGRNLDLLNQINACASPVSLHVRRGDYTLTAEGNIALPLNYYDKAIHTILTLYPNATFFVFSDDIEYAKANLPLGRGTVFVDHNDSYNAHEDLRLMAACHQHVIANSTFSWWGAWLNSRTGKTVIAPRHWLLSRESYFPNLFPPSWILLDSLRAN